MPGKKNQCSYCSEVIRSDNLKNQPSVAAGQIGPISAFNRAEFETGKPAETGPRNPKLQALLGNH